KPDQQSRAYSKDEAERIANGQAAHNALATRIAYDAGLRAHELLTLRRSDEAGPTRARQWRSDLFQGRTGVRYVVTGKGGLSREVMLSHGLSLALEGRRLGAPRWVRDRKINYQSHYAIGGGHGWSNSFTKRSKTEFGHSRGAHGLRHGFAQSRFATLKARASSEKDAKQILSQELGHFREEIVEVYLR
ncbi:MAG: site-specific integrase, partial [Geminicoccaceae bacterium]